MVGGSATRTHEHVEIESIVFVKIVTLKLIKAEPQLEQVGDRIADRGSSELKVVVGGFELVSGSQISGARSRSF